MDELLGEPDEATFEQLYRRWRSDVVVLTRRLLGESRDAEDAAQEAFLRAWLGWRQYSSERPFWPWIAAIAKRTCFDHRRGQAHESANSGNVDMKSRVQQVTEASPERVVEAGDDLRIVFRLLEGLRPVERRALVRRQLDGWSYKRIATVEGVTVEAVRGSLKRARASLRQSLPVDLVNGVSMAREEVPPDGSPADEYAGFNSPVLKLS